MLINVSYNKPAIDRSIDVALGNSFSFLERLKRRGIGSPKLWIHSASSDTERLLGQDSYNNTCNIELRPEGMILRFRSLLETYALVLPFRTSQIQLNREGLYELRTAEHFIRILSSKENTRRYFNRMFRELDI